MEYLKFKNESNFKKWDKDQFLEYFEERKAADPESAVACKDSIHKCRVLGRRNGALITDSGFTTRWAESTSNEVNNFVVCNVAAAREGFALEEVLKTYNAEIISEEEAIEQGLVIAYEEV